jgi:tetratricopeptide (TPR) repeat protein
MRTKLAGAANILKDEGLLLRHSFKSFFEGLTLLRDNALNKAEIWNLIMRNCLFSINNTLLAKKDQNALIGLYALWKRNLSMIPQEMNVRDPSVLQLLTSGIQLSEGRIESGAKTLEDILQSSKLDFVKREAQERLFHCYTSTGSWQAMSEVLETIKRPPDFERYFAADLNALSYWNNSTGPVQFNPLTEIVIRGPSDAFAHISMQRIQESFGNATSDAREAVEFLKTILRLSLPKPVERSVEGLIWAQFMVNFTADHKSFDTATQIRLGKAKPSDRVTNLSIYNKDLLRLLKMYSLAKSAEKLGKARKARDPDLDEIGGLLANLARNTRNIKLAHELLDSSLRNLTLSASMRKQYKQARLLFQEKRLDEAANVLLKVIDTPLPTSTIADQEVISKSLLLLAGWNSEHPFDFTQADFPDLLRDIFGPDFPFNMSRMLPEDIEYALLKQAIKKAPDYSKSWFAYGSFNYRFGRTLLDDLNTSYTAPYFQAELRDLETILKGTSFTRTDIIKTLLQELREHEHESVAKNWKENGNLNSEKWTQVEMIVDHIRKSIFEKFDIACKAYFRYLIVQGTADSQHEKSRRKQGDIITATLRLIRIFARYGVGLQSTFQEGFSDTPLRSWKVVIPQLFSRLYHPEPIVCQEITNLLCRITHEYPHLMCYPAVLGAAEAEIDQDRSAEEAYSKILDAIRNVNGDLVPEMTKWTQELRRITVLWEETWLIGLEHLKNEMNNRITKIQEDLERIENNATLAEMERVEIKSNTISNLMKPILFSLDKLSDQTYRMDASSPHEVTFLEKYMQKLELGYQSLEEATDLESVKSAWTPFLEIHKELSEFAIQCRLNPLQLSELSPYLSNLSHSHIYMPGIGLDDEKVAACSPTIKVLPSKTKPKKIELHSTSGDTYVFLLKGHEDLHLDEKIEQFLDITNTLLYCEKPTRSRGLNVRTYNVIPFASNYGMIQWVDNAHGLFSLYRKSQIHEYNMRAATKKDSGTLPPPPRPHEVFARKVILAHKEGKLNKKDPRHKWPIKAMLEIWNELKKETPSDIMSNELWTSSHSADNWWSKTSNFSRSLAVMSIVGYALGLGDRHLDNILIDLKRGEVIHIDFNVCFEKGKRLKIPETVPFRLTQNLLRALGPSGVDGHFRIACENVMRIMRDNREVLLTLLEAFIYDPLVDWIKEEGMEKQILELNVSIGLFSSRIGKVSVLM